MDLSVMIATKGRFAQVAAQVAHLRATIDPTIPYEILVHDATPGAVGTIDGARVVHAPETPGQAFNHMAEEAKGTYLFPLGDDMKIYPRTMTTALTLMRQLPKGTVGIPFHADPGFPCHAYAICPEMLCIARETFHWLGGYDPQFHYGYSDSDFGMKAYAAKLPILLLMGVCVEHQHIDDTTKKRNMEKFEEDQNKFYAKWPSRPLWGVVADNQQVDFRTPKYCPFPHEN